MEGIRRMEKVRWGVLGAASIARTRALPAMKLAPSVELIALASRTLDKATALCAELGIPRPYGSYAELLADPDIDAVYLPLPNTLHTEWASKAMEAGKHVLCEKPLALSVDDIDELQAVRDRTGRHIEEAFVYRNHPQWAYLTELLHGAPAGPDGIGAVRAAHVTMAMQFHDPNDIRNNPELGGGALYDMGGYVISALKMIFGRDPHRVLATLDRDPVTRIDRLTTAILDYGDAHGVLTVSTQAGPNGRGSHQLLSVLGGTGWLRSDYPLAHAAPTESHIYLGNDQSYGGFETSVVTFPPVNQYTLQAERFSRHLQGHAVPTWPIEDANTTLRTINALFESARNNRWEPIEKPKAHPDGGPTLEQGDRVVAVRDIDTTQGIRIPEGTEGTIAEDRGSNLVVYFEEEPKRTSVEEGDLHKLAD
jgi:predicted dehydrogenase